VPGSPYPGGFGPVGIAPLPNGKFVYASTDVDSSPADRGALDAFAVRPFDGSLRPLPGSPFADGGHGPGYSSFSVLPNQGPLAHFRFAARSQAEEEGEDEEGDGRSDQLSLRFDASDSVDPDGLVAHYTWDFGDGVIVDTVEHQTTHVYARAGRFTVTLTVTDNEGCSTTLVSIGRAVLCAGTTAATTSRIVTVGG